MPPRDARLSLGHPQLPAGATIITTILVPTDGSEHAEKAIGLAADIAEKYGSRVVLLHVLLRGEPEAELRRMAVVEHLIDERAGRPATEARNPLSGGAGFAEAEERGLSTWVLDRIGRQILESAASRMRQKGVGTIETRIVDGDPAKAILEAAEEEGANLIVMGSRGLGTLKGLLLGSVSQKVSQLAPCTCMTVR